MHVTKLLAWYVATYNFRTFARDSSRFWWPVNEMNQLVRNWLISSNGRTLMASESMPR